MAKQRRPGKTRVAQKRRAVRPGPADPPAFPAVDRSTREAPTPAPRPGYHEAITLYEGAVRLLQRHEFEQAAEQFRSVIGRFPDERELLERARLYLRVCERETTRRPTASPRTPEERVYAATMALNAGDVEAALDYLRQALAERPDSDHGQYIMAVALTDAGDLHSACAHLQEAIRLNPDNRSLARQDPDLEPLRTFDRFTTVVEMTAPPKAMPQERDRKLRRR